MKNIKRERRVKVVMEKRKEKEEKKRTCGGVVQGKKRGDSVSVSGYVLFKEVSPCLMSLV